MAAEPVKKPASSDLAKKLTQKLGPLPVWAWAASALVLVYAYRKNKASTAATVAAGSATPTAADQASGLTSDGGLMGSGAGGGAGFGSGMPNPNTPLPYDSSIPYDFNPWVYQNGTTTATGTSNVPATATTTPATTPAVSQTVSSSPGGVQGIADYVASVPVGTQAQTPSADVIAALAGYPGATPTPNGATSAVSTPTGAITYNVPTAVAPVANALNNMIVNQATQGTGGQSNPQAAAPKAAPTPKPTATTIPSPPFPTWSPTSRT